MSPWINKRFLRVFIRELRRVLPDRPLPQACKDFGFFYLENHGVPEKVVRHVFDQWKAFFTLGIEAKMTVKADKNNRGYMRMHEETVDPDHQSKGDTKVERSFTILSDLGYP